MSYGFIVCRIKMTSGETFLWRALKQKCRRGKELRGETSMSKRPSETTKLAKTMSYLLRAEHPHEFYELRIIKILLCDFFTMSYRPCVQSDITLKTIQHCKQDGGG